MKQNASLYHKAIAVLPAIAESFGVGAVFAVALLIRLGLMLALKTYQFDSEWDYGYEYARIARWILWGEGFSSPYFDTPRPSAIMAPAYVYFIVSIFSLFGIYSIPSAIVLLSLQSLFAALTCVVFYHLGSTMFSRPVGILAAIAMALYPPAIFFSVMRVHPAVLIVLLVALVIACLLRIRDARSYGVPILCGVLMGFTALVEPTVLSFFALCFAWLFFYSSNSKTWISRQLIVMACFALLTVLPWTIRNYVVFRALVPIKSAFGLNLLEGNNPYGNGVFQYTKGFFSVEEREKIHQQKETPEELNRAEMISDAERQQMRSLDEVQADKLMYKKAVDYIKEQPLRFLQLTGRRIFAFWSPVNPYRMTQYDALRGIVYGIVLGLGIIGVILAKKNRPTTVLLLLLFAFYPATYYLTHVSMYRYRYPVEPFLILLACFVLRECSEMFSATSRRGLPPSPTSASIN